jgi:hypothetical protein
MDCGWEGGRQGKGWGVDGCSAIDAYLTTTQQVCASCDTHKCMPMNVRVRVQASHRGAALRHS